MPPRPRTRGRTSRSAALDGESSSAAPSGPPSRAPEQTLRPQQHDDEKDDEYRAVLELVRQEQGRELLHQPDRQSAEEGARYAAQAAEHDAGIHDDDVLETDIRLERTAGGEQAAADGRHGDAESESQAMGPIDVDAHVHGGLGIVRRRAQRLAEPRPA